jgi:hypothetical protein
MKKKYHSAYEEVEPEDLFILEYSDISRSKGMRYKKYLETLCEP